MSSLVNFNDFKKKNEEVEENEIKLEIGMKYLYRDITGNDFVSMVVDTDRDIALISFNSGTAIKTIPSSANKREALDSLMSQLGGEILEEIPFQIVLSEK